MVCQPVLVAVLCCAVVSLSTAGMSVNGAICEPVCFVDVNPTTLCVCLCAMSQCGAAWVTIVCVVCSVTFWLTAL